MIRRRQVLPELLHGLPADDPRALHARKDIKRINGLLRHHRVMAAALAEHWLAASPPRLLIDLGAGDGSFALRVARPLSRRWQNVRVLLVDRQAAVSDVTRERFRRLGWDAEAVTMDVFAFLETTTSPSAQAMMANLFLHELPQDQLARLFTHAAQRARLLVACEPRRALFPLAASRLLWAIGCGEVARHDAAVSVRAGFRKSELSDLWPQQGRWVVREREVGLFSHRFVARRDDVGTQR